MTPSATTPSPVNFLSSDVEITGTLSFSEPLILEGKMIGDILTTGLLTVAERGSVLGDIHAEAVSIRGQVKGNVTVQERCELHSNAQLHGDLKSPRLIIAEGATFMGQSEVIPAGTTIEAKTRR